MPLDYSPEQLIKNAARDIGFCSVGIAGITPSDESSRAFDRWIDAGMHGEMRYLSGGADKRYDPGLLLDDAKSVVSVAVDYYSPSRVARNSARAEAGEGIFSIYAHGMDYHRVLEAMLGELEHRLKAFFPDLRTRICVDTQPISERDFAIRSGIAWLGKNTCVITPSHGSWVFLGELLTNLDLDTDLPLESLCGSCTLCSDVCPTGALDEAYVLDATRCISYLTIEKRGGIPSGFHSSIGQHLFGCDECQRVCPYNAVATKSNIFVDDGAGKSLLDMNLAELASITDTDFRERTRESAIARCKAAGLRRNAGIVLRNRAGRGG